MEVKELELALDEAHSYKKNHLQCLLSVTESDKTILFLIYNNEGNVNYKYHVVKFPEELGLEQD